MRARRGPSAGSGSPSPALPWRERTVIGRYYYSDVTMKQIGSEIGVNESRVSQLHTRAIGRLRERLGADFAPNALPTALDRAAKQRGGKLAMAKASLAARRAGTESRSAAAGRTSVRAARVRASGRARRPLKAVAAVRTPAPVAAAS